MVHVPLGNSVYHPWVKGLYHPMCLVVFRGIRGGLGVSVRLCCWLLVFRTHSVFLLMFEVFRSHSVFLSTFEVFRCHLWGFSVLCLEMVHSAESHVFVIFVRNLMFFEGISYFREGHVIRSFSVKVSWRFSQICCFLYVSSIFSRIENSP